MGAVPICDITPTQTLPPACAKALADRRQAGVKGLRLRLRPSFRLGLRPRGASAPEGESSSSERGASAPEGEPLARRGEEIFDFLRDHHKMKSVDFWPLTNYEHMIIIEVERSS